MDEIRLEISLNIEKTKKLLRKYETKKYKENEINLIRNKIYNLSKQI
jgi:hypothetical protein